MKAFILKLVSVIKRIIVEPCLEQDEPYAIRSRKLGVIAVAIVASNAFFLGIPIVVITSLLNPTIGIKITAFAAFFLLVTSSIVPYTYLRRTKKLPEWLADLQIWSTIPTTLCFSLFAHQGSVLVVCTIAILMGIVLRVRAWQLLLVYGMAANVMHALINDYAGEIPQLHSTFFNPQPLSIRIMSLVGSSVCPLLFFGLGLHSIMKESVSHANQADAAIAMNLAVADKLRRYDTDGVAVILAANKGKVDEKLLEAFAGIQRNLQEYRPHIPDYVIAASVSECSPSTDDEDEGELRVSQWSRLLARTSNCSIESSKSKAEQTNNEDVKTSTHTSLNASRTEEMEASPGAHVHRRKSSVKIKISTSGNHEEGVSSRRQHFYGRATTVFLRFTSPAFSTSQAMKTSAASTTATLSNCIDAASKHAKAHNGAMQYMQGCGLMVSFNAASRVATHEASACAFALALKTSVDEMLGTDLVMHATIVTTNVLSFFAGNSGQLMLTVLGGFMPVHTAMHYYLSQTVGKAASCVLLSDSVVPTIDMMYDHRLLGMTIYADDCFVNGRSNVAGAASHTRALSSTVSELLTFKISTDDEWLYHAAERDQDDPITRSNNAVRAALDGDAIPVEFSTQCDTSDVVLMKCVKERLENCSRDESPFEVRTIPTVMW